MKCERCQKNPAQVRVEAMVNGKRESHFLCQSCVEELMSELNQTGGLGDSDFAGAPFGFAANNDKSFASAARAGGVNTATAEKQNKHSKTPTLDQYGRD
ncbi:hypothetical protein KDW_52440 [Dictyobacter vulcani]|uniref:Uncharacterized protein n=1 Tax=Dictyobacter vulcani TaxID=2607529 RepID=A0A5J4KV53_9CHLR|nr:hypothetical protein [Dictyobacter vulcani]GER91082.1 hypothetical protein KDW_52440 [Dictyobacter vulcani]